MIFVSLTVYYILKLFIESFLVFHEIQGFKYEKHKKSYYVDRHEDEDVVSDRKAYLVKNFDLEI